ncbi:MAG TPA: NAD-dependent epimerase/dehydratase family protein [Acidobacteriaceae bacterium]|jgi:CDP-paratose 2-epimerase|nr:NAD-dependent epimerase/dehydratase family protein [Acidobacteriaceae bacterium]
MMSVAVITGAAGLVGSESVAYFSSQGMTIVGIDNGMREEFFGQEASTRWIRERLIATVPGYRHYEVDVRSYESIAEIFARYGSAIELVIHTAAQPSHDWAAREPFTDFSVNANGTSVMLEATRRYAPDATFILTSTNKVYGDTPNSLPLEEKKLRWEIMSTHAYFAAGIPETMSIDYTTHSLFGASKVAADILVQEYGRYFGMKTACFRGGCLTGPNHSGTQLHGFLSYLLKCAATGTPYKVFGYKGKQVRDNIHSADLVRAFDAFFREPRSGEVYNMGGGRYSNCSMLEAIALSQEITGNELQWTYMDDNRRGDHIWWISDLTRFQSHYPEWEPEYDVQRILQESFEMNAERWRATCSI